MKTGNKSDSMEMNKQEQTWRLLGMILFIELFANAKRFGFLNLHLGICIFKWNCYIAIYTHMAMCEMGVMDIEYS